MFGKKNHVDIELNADVERLLKSAKEGVLPIVEAGEPVLREQCVRYDGQLSKHTLHKLIETMHKTMLDAPGVGSFTRRSASILPLQWWRTTRTVMMTAIRAR